MPPLDQERPEPRRRQRPQQGAAGRQVENVAAVDQRRHHQQRQAVARPCRLGHRAIVEQPGRSEEHTSELQSLMRISYAVFCVKKKNQTTIIEYKIIQTIEATKQYYN